MRRVVKPSGQYWNRPDTIETIWTLLKPYGHYWNRPDIIETVRTLLKPSGQHWNRLDTFECVWTVSKPSGVRTILKLPRYYWICLDNVKIVRTMLKLSWNKYHQSPWNQCLEERSRKAIECMFSSVVKVWLNSNFALLVTEKRDKRNACHSVWQWWAVWEWLVGISNCEGWWLSPGLLHTLDHFSFVRNENALQPNNSTRLKSIETIF